MGCLGQGFAQRVNMRVQGIDKNFNLLPGTSELEEGWNYGDGNGKKAYGAKHGEKI